MCKTKMAIDAASPSSTRRASRTRASPSQSQPSFQTPTPPIASSSAATSSFFPPSPSYTASTGYRLTSDTSISSPSSLPTFRHALPESPHIYDFSEISSATNNFLSNRYSSSSATPSWRCTLRGRNVVVFRRQFRRRIETAQLGQRLSVICRSHHVSIVKLLGASISGQNIYLVYEFLGGANLSDCLRNPKNPQFTVLSSWISRMQVATDIAHGLDYIHNRMGLDVTFVHNHIDSNGIIVTEPSFNAKICHFGAAQLCGEVEEIADKSSSSPSLTRSNELKPTSSVRIKIEGVRGYMSPEFQCTGVATKKSDVYAFGVVMLELLSGEEPLKYVLDKKTGDYMRTSVIETARTAVESGACGGDGDGGESRLRKWLDRRLKDSFPIQVADRVTRVALECVHVDPEERPDMTRVAGRISKLYLESKTWSDNIRVPSEISVSLAPR